MITEVEESEGYYEGCGIPSIEDCMEIEPKPEPKPTSSKSGKGSKSSKSGKSGKSS